MLRQLATMALRHEKQLVQSQPKESVRLICKGNANTELIAFP